MSEGRVGIADTSHSAMFRASANSPTVSGQVNDQHFWFNLTGGIPAPTPAVPEPGSIALLGTGLAALAFVGRTIKGRQ